MFAFGVVATLAVLLAVLVVALAYTSTPEDVFEFAFMLDVPAIRARWARRWSRARRLAAKVAGWLW